MANWREQDHYKLMGLQNYRLKASAAMIKAAFKIQTIEQHPDKKSTNDWSETDRAQADGYYTCVKKAFEVLGDPTQRRLYDSVDATDEDDAVPAKTKKEANFFKKFGPAFDRNKKWFAPHPSATKPAGSRPSSPAFVELPSLGEEDASKEAVDHFYEVWYAAESWREFGYFDEETVRQILILLLRHDFDFETGFSHTFQRHATPHARRAVGLLGARAHSDLSVCPHDSSVHVLRPTTTTRASRSDGSRRKTRPPGSARTRRRRPGSCS